MVKAGAKNFLIDGFPRALDQAECFEKLVKAPEMVLAFDCPEVGCRFLGTVLAF
jgi:adenylate kinase